MRSISIAVMIALCSLGPSAQAQHRITFEDLDGVSEAQSSLFEGVDISGDGKALAVVRGPKLEVLDVTTGKVLYDLGEGQLPHWSPSGRRLAFYSLRSGTMQLWYWNADTREIFQITAIEGGVDPDPTTRINGYVIGAFDYSWSPDDLHIVFVSRVAQARPNQNTYSPLILNGTTSPDLTLAGIFTNPAGATGGIPVSPDGRQWRYRQRPPGITLVSRLFVANVESKEITVLDGQTGNAFNPRWSPDGKRIAFAAIDEADDIFSADSGAVRLRDVASGEISSLATGPGMKFWPRWSRDGKSIAFLTGGTKPDIQTVTLDQKTITSIPLGKYILRYDWAFDGDGLLVSYVDGKAQRLHRLGHRSGLVADVMGVGAQWAQASQGTLVWIEGLFDGTMIQHRNLGQTKVRTLTRVPTNKELNNDLTLGKIEEITYRNKHGDELRGMLLYPPDYQGGKVYPLIVDAYPVSRGGNWMAPMSGNQTWAASGYLVFKPYVRAPHAWPNCSGDVNFCSRSRGSLGWDTMVDDVMSGVDALIARGLADPKRMCAYGHSNGGGVVSYLITRTNRFKCAVIVAPVWPSWVGSSLLSTQLPQLMNDWVGKDILSDPDEYVKLSAVFRARNVETPVLIAAGDDDGMFLLGAIEMYNALRFAGKDVTLLRYPGQRHIFDGEGLKDFWHREMAFFHEYLE